MKNTIIGLLAAAILSCSHPESEPQYTNVSIRNSSPLDSVLVYVTLQSPNSVIGLFGIQDTIGSRSKGTFYAHKDTTYTTNLSSKLLGAVVSFQGDNLPCQVAVKAGFPTGINIFEFSINTPFECFDISCEDGMNSMLKASVSDTLNWSTGDGIHIAPFNTSKNVFPLKNNINIRGVFPYRCTDCTNLGKAIPQNCLNLPDTCSSFRACQVARTNHNGGIILLEYLSPVPQICK